MRRGVRAVSVVVAVASVLLAASCSDDDGRADQAGNVTAPPATLETSTTVDPPSGEPGSLSGTAWRLEEIVDPDGTTVDVTDASVPAIVSFGDQGVDVFDGVNTVGGEYSVDGGEVQLELGTPSEFPYPDDQPQYALIPGLAQLERAALDGARLQLTLRDGTVFDFSQATNQATG